MQLRSEIYRPCKNKEFDCSFEGLYNQLVKHEAFCHRYECPFKDLYHCIINGKKYELSNHCCRNHRSELNQQWRVWGNGKLMMQHEKMIIIYFYSNIFKVCRKSTGHDIFWTIILYGSKEQAEKYKLSIEFRDEATTLSFSACCRSIEDETDVEKNYLHISLKQLYSFSHDCDYTISITENK